ncbi:MAG: ACT domain-containing protein [Eubacterium sp.]
MIRQVSVFIQNQEGKMNSVLKALAKNDINVRSINIAETADYGIMRLILQETEKGLAVLKENNIMANETQVLAVEVPDRPGGLSGLVDLLTAHNINIEYAYSFLPKNTSNAIIICKVNAELMEKAKEILKEGQHISLLNREELLMK